MASTKNGIIFLSRNR